PIYGNRAYLRKLRDGRLVMTFRNASSGTTGTCAFAWHPDEKLPYTPQSFLPDESRCVLRSGTMELRTSEGRDKAAQFLLYPMEDDESSLQLEFELQVQEAGPNACNVSARAWVRFLPNRVEIANRPADGFTLDATKWHRYRLVNQGLRLAVYMDGEKRLEAPTAGIYTREVRF